jgi:hypothetical protein
MSFFANQLGPLPPAMTEPMGPYKGLKAPAAPAKPGATPQRQSAAPEPEKKKKKGWF